MSAEQKDILSVSGDVSQGAVFAKIKMPVPASFTPLPDITAYELALILPYILGQKILYQEDYEALGTAQRHCPVAEGFKFPK